MAPRSASGMRFISVIIILSESVTGTGSLVVTAPARLNTATLVSCKATFLKARTFRHTAATVGPAMTA